MSKRLCVSRRVAILKPLQNGRMVANSASSCLLVASARSQIRTAACPKAACLALLFLLAWFGCSPSAAEAANWRDLTGRVAPDLVFDETEQDLKPGTKLSSFRGKQVVLLVFWLRDCAHCRRELPKVQRLHERLGSSGLKVISVVHQFPPSQVLGVMKKRGWTFSVARDQKGQLAARYGGGRRPGYYVIGIDGRVKSSNALNEQVVLKELGRWRVHELGPVPAELKAARVLVGAGDYGAALRSAEAVAKRPNVSAEVQAAVERLSRLAGKKLQNRVTRAKVWAASGQRARAAEEYHGIVKTFRGTSLESRAKALQGVFLEEYPK